MLKKLGIALLFALMLAGCQSNQPSTSSGTDNPSNNSQQQVQNKEGSIQFPCQ